MQVGTKSLLFGTHQIFWHPLTVGLAWRRVHGRWPRWREWVAILFHDWGYWGCPNMDGEAGRKHPELGARIAGTLAGRDAYWLALLHSGHYARLLGADPSALCLPDKVSVLFDPPWFYLIRARLSGEIKEYVSNSPLNDAPEEVWLMWYRGRVKEKLNARFTR